MTMNELCAESARRHDAWVRRILEAGRASAECARWARRCHRRSGPGGPRRHCSTE